MITIRIGSGAGYGGDRIEPAVELMEKGNLDYIIFECLAERTIALSQKEKRRDSSRGYNPMLEYRMERILPLAKEKNIKVITNMGAANVQAAAEVTARIAEKLGISGIRIACVTGDDIADQLDKYEENEILETGGKLKLLKESIISANAYLGAEGILEALENGADVVITGRVADPALVIGPLVHEFGWDIRKGADRDADRMGQAVLAGHLLECAGQVTGGYYADPGYKDVPDLHKLGYPLVEIDETGAFIVTKVEGSGGLVTEDTCKEQMIYEIHDPKSYVTPDAIADFSAVTFRQAGTDRVRAEHATSCGKPDMLKVSIGYEDCWIGEGEISYGGSNCMRRAQLAEEIVRKRLKLIGAQLEEYRCDYIGYNSLYRDKIAHQMAASGLQVSDRKQASGGQPISEGELARWEPPEVRLRISGRTRDEKNAVMIANEVEALYTNGPAGGGGVVKRLEQVVSVCSIFVPRDEIGHEVHYLEVQ